MAKRVQTSTLVILILACLVFMGGTVIWVFLQKSDRERFFNPAIDDAERGLAAFARSTNGTYALSVHRLNRPLFQAAASSEDPEGDLEMRPIRGDGGVELTQGGFRTRVGWIIVKLRVGSALLPRVRVHLPASVFFDLSVGPRGNWQDSRGPWDLLGRDLYYADDYGPRVQLTLPEHEAFNLLRARACRVYVSTEARTNQLSGRLPDRYPLYVEAWGRAGSRAGWREDVDQKELRELVDETVRFAQALALRPGAN